MSTSKPANDVLYAACPCGSGKKYKFCCFKSKAGEAQDMHETVPHQEKILFLDPEDLEPPPEVVAETARGTKLMQSARFKEARDVFQSLVERHPRVAQCQNNLATCDFHLGNLDGAITRLRSILRHKPHHAYARGLLVEILAATGQEVELSKELPKLRDSVPLSNDHVEVKVTALALARQHRDALAAAQKAGQPLRPHVAYLAGIAALNLGMLDRAQELLTQGLADTSTRDRAKVLLRELEAGRRPFTLTGEYPYLHPFQWFSQRLLEPEALRQMEDIPERRRWPIWLDLAVCTLEEDNGRDVKIIRLLQSLGTPGAIEVLRKIAGGTAGTEELRMNAVMALAELGAIDPDQPFRVFVRGAWTDVRISGVGHNAEASRTAAENRMEEMFELPANVMDAYQEAMAANQKHNWSKAEKSFRTVLKQVPDHPVVLANLACAVVNHAQDLAQAEELLTRALKTAPDYHFARGLLGDILCQQKRLDEAAKVLDPKYLTGPALPNGLAYLMAARCRLHALKGEMESALHHLRMAKEVDPELPFVQYMDKMLARGSAFFSAINTIRDELLEANARGRRRVLHDQAHLSACYEAMETPRLKQILQNIGGRKRWLNGKGGIINQIGTLLRTPETLRLVTACLSVNARTALHDLLSRGGRCDYISFTARFNVQASPVATAEHPLPEPTALDELEDVGLVVEGTVGNTESVLVPFELRALLGPVLDAMPPAAEPPHAP